MLGFLHIIPNYLGSFAMKLTAHNAEPIPQYHGYQTLADYLGLMQPDSALYQQ